MNRFNSLLAAHVLLCSGLVLAGSAQDLLTVDVTKQSSPPARARGFPLGPATPGHTPGLPIRLDLVVPTGELRADGTILIDFRITNVGSGPITLPSADRQGNLLPTPPNTDYMLDRLTLYLTSDGIADQIFGRKYNSGTDSLTVTSAELYGRSDDPQSFYLLAPNMSIQVHASSRVRLESGLHSLTAHAYLTRSSIGLNVDSRAQNTVHEDSVGGSESADSQAVTKMLLRAGP